MNRPCVAAAGLFAAVSLVVSCSSSDGPAAARGPVHPVAFVAHDVPSAYLPSAAVELPSDLPDAESFELVLWERSGVDPAVVGRFERLTPVGLPSPDEPTVLGATGPSGLVGVVGGTDVEVRLVTRDLSADELLALVSSDPFAGSSEVSADGVWTASARQSVASVPGIGSLPLAPVVGTAASWIREPTIDEPIRGFIGVGAYESTGDDLDVLSWWVGETSEVDGRLEVELPAYDDEASDGSVGEVPLATLTAWSEGDATVVVRVVGLDDDDRRAVVEAVGRASVEEWSALRQSVGQAAGRGVVAAGADPEWRLLREQQDGAAALCLEVESGGGTDRTCLAGSEIVLAAGGPVGRWAGGPVGRWAGGPVGRWAGGPTEPGGHRSGGVLRGHAGRGVIRGGPRRVRRGGRDGRGGHARRRRLRIGRRCWTRCAGGRPRCRRRRGGGLHRTAGAGMTAALNSPTTIEPLVLETPRTRLVPIGLEDEAFVRDLERSPDVVLRYRRGASFAGSRPSSDVAAQFVVVDREASRRAGVAVLYGVDLAAGHARVAVAVSDEYRNASWLGEAYLLFTRYAFRAFPLHKLYGEVPAYNDEQVRGGAGRLFVEEGRLADHVWADGRWWDLVYYSLDRAAFEALDELRPLGAGLTARLRARELVRS